MALYDLKEKKKVRQNHFGVVFKMSSGVLVFSLMDGITEGPETTVCDSSARIGKDDKLQSSNPAVNILSINIKNTVYI